jgi:hypothetical protein
LTGKEHKLTEVVESCQCNGSHFPLVGSCHAQDDDGETEQVDLDLGASREGSRTGKMLTNLQYTQII